MGMFVGAPLPTPQIPRLGLRPPSEWQREISSRPREWSGPLFLSSRPRAQRARAEGSMGMFVGAPLTTPQIPRLGLRPPSE